MPITVKGQATVPKRIPLAKRVTSGGGGGSRSPSQPTQTNATSTTSAAPIPAGAIGQRADGSYIFPTPPADAIGQRADGTYILAPSSTSPASANGGGAGLPKFNYGGLAKTVVSGAQSTIKETTGTIAGSVATGASAVAGAGKSLVSGTGNLFGGWEAVGDRISSGGGLLTSPGELAEDTGAVIGKTAAAAVNPVLVPLAILVAVYAFSSN